MTLMYDKVAINNLEAKHTSEYVWMYIRTGIQILNKYLADDDVVYIIIEPNNDSSKEVIMLGASYIRPSVDDGRKTVAKIILRES